MSCVQFNWGGCQGNENNFLSERECQLRCQDSGRSKGKSTLSLILVIRITLSQMPMFIASKCGHLN